MLVRAFDRLLHPNRAHHADRHGVGALLEKNTCRGGHPHSLFTVLAAVRQAVSYRLPLVRVVTQHPYGVRVCWHAYDKGGVFGFHCGPIFVPSSMVALLVLFPSD